MPEYDEKTEEILTHALIREFEINDWIRLALACFDQAGMGVKMQQRVQDLVTKWLVSLGG